MVLPFFIVPSFKSDPRLNSKFPVVQLGSIVVLDGCRFNASFPLQTHEAFWMKDNKIFRNLTSSAFEAFDSLVLDKFSIKDVGEYRCAIKVSVSNKLILSKGIKIDVNG